MTPTKGVSNESRASISAPAGHTSRQRKATPGGSLAYRQGAGPALYLAKLFGSNDTEMMVRLITALLVLMLDPLALLLTLAVSRDN